MGRDANGTWTRRWVPPDYEVDERGKVIGNPLDAHPSNWGRWGDEDQRGAANLLTPARVLAAAELVKRGEVISCALPVGGPSPHHPSRSGPILLQTTSGADDIVGSAIGRHLRGLQTSDDHLSMPVQSSTHWDALSHVGHSDRLYNGWWTGTSEATAGARRCSIENVHDSLVGRGVLVDVARHLEVPRLAPGTHIEPELLDECLRRQHTELAAGDLLLVRTGHLTWFFDPDRSEDFWERPEPGLSRRCADWVARHDLAAVSMDNVAIEAEPMAGEGPAYPLHIQLVRDLGVHLGELWWLEDLAAVCTEMGRFEFLLSAQPIRLRGASGSMVNPVAIL